MALWCESRGFRTSIVERRFADDFRVAGDEPRVALCGVDNAPARADLEVLVSTALLKRDWVPAPRNTLHFRLIPSRRSDPQGIAGGRRDTSLMRTPWPTIRRTAH